MKKLKYLVFGLIVLFVSISHVKAYDYYIEDYNVDIKVNKDNSFDITETIKTNFNIYSHGIFRNIPLHNEVTRLDGTKTKNKAKVSNIQVSEDYTKRNENGNCVLKIGSADKTIRGLHTYVISYNYNIGKDKLKDKDEFYFNIIGPEWEDTVINRTTFKIVMPEEFDKTLLGFSNGSVGSTTNNVKYVVNGNTITGSLNVPIYSGQSLTIRLELPDNYFSEAKTVIDVSEVMSIFFPIIMLSFAYLIYKVKSETKVIDPVEFYAPDDLNSLEVAFIYKGKADGNDVTSLLVYLASKGYLRIEESKSKSIFQDKNIKLIKLKDYDGEKTDEKIFFERLFFKQEEVTLSQLKYSFHSTINAILDLINSREAKQKVINKNNNVYKVLLGIMAYLAFVGSSLINMANSYEMESLLLIPISLFYVPFIVIGVKIIKDNKIFGLFWNGFVVFHGSAFYFGVCGSHITSYYFLPIAIICTILIIIIGNKFVSRTEYGSEVYGKIMGFRKFLVRARKEELENLVNEHPSYFYDILPFAYVLGISNKWIKKFETLNIAPVNWYSSSDMITVHSMGLLMTSTAKTLNYRVINRSSGGGSSGSSFSSGSSSSGGGSSGGGSGGGGGGRW